jgi:hypothetical protein
MDIEEELAGAANGVSDCQQVRASLGGECLSTSPRRSRDENRLRCSTSRANRVDCSLNLMNRRHHGSVKSRTQVRMLTELAQVERLGMSWGFESRLAFTRYPNLDISNLVHNTELEQMMSRGNSLVITPTYDDARLAGIVSSQKRPEVGELSISRASLTNDLTVEPSVVMLLCVSVSSLVRVFRAHTTSTMT